MSDHIRALGSSRGIGSPWTHWVAVLTSAATVVLIVAGGLVTNTGSGLAVPDWPTTFGYNMFFYPWSKMVGGIFYEHSHRLIGSVVGLLTLALVFLLWFKESRRPLLWLGAVALSAVIVQGVLGGLRVVLPSAGGRLAIVHGCVAQAFFALTVTLALLTSEEWTQRPQKILHAEAGALKRLCLLTTGLVSLQVIFGAMLTHTGSFLHLHLLFAAMVMVHVFLLARRISRHHSDQPTFMRSGRTLFGLLVAQLLLGAASYVARFTAVQIPYASVIGLALAAAHRVNGALMLGACVLLTLQAYRLVTSPQPVGGQGLVGEQIRA